MDTIAKYVRTVAGAPAPGRSPTSNPPPIAPGLPPARSSMNSPVASFMSPRRGGLGAWGGALVGLFAMFGLPAAFIVATTTPRAAVARGTTAAQPLETAAAAGLAPCSCAS